MSSRCVYRVAQGFLQHSKQAQGYLLWQGCGHVMMDEGNFHMLLG